MASFEGASASQPHYGNQQLVEPRAPPVQESQPPAASPTASLPPANGTASTPSDADEVAKLRGQLQRLKAQLVASAQSADEDAERQAAAAVEQAAVLQRERDALQAALDAAQQQLDGGKADRAEVCLDMETEDVDYASSCFTCISSSMQQSLLQRDTLLL